MAVSGLYARPVRSSVWSAGEHARRAVPDKGRHFLEPDEVFTDHSIGAWIEVKMTRARTPPLDLRTV
ncbi:MAG: hypothetical protein ABI389_08450 [Rhodanobacter sp.]